MRITNNLMMGTLLRDLNTNATKMNTLQEQLSTGKRINRPSDDPVGVVNALRLRSNLNELDKYKSNADDANSWLGTTDGALNEAGSVLARVKELAVQAANGTNPQEALDAINKEVNQLGQQLVQIGNTTYAGKYLFSGTKTQTATFDAAGNFQGNTNAINYEIGTGAQIPINVDGTQAFGNVFTVINNLKIDLAAGNSNGISGSLNQIDTVTNQMLATRSEIGARMNRLDLAINRIDDQNTNMTSVLSNTEDADMTQVITQLKMQENVYQSSLAAGARIVQPSLMDFLK